MFAISVGVSDRLWEFEDILVSIETAEFATTKRPIQ